MEIELKKDEFISKQTQLADFFNKIDKAFELKEVPEDMSMVMTISSPEEIDVEVIKVENTGDYLNLQDTISNLPLESIVFPFFTQAKKRRVNFNYQFKDLGMDMEVSLPSGLKEGKLIKQPGSFEKEIFELIISMYQKVYEETDRYPKYVFLTPKDFIENFLENKMTNKYYVKVEDALRNLQYTDYQFTTKNHKKAGNFIFTDKRFSLISYQKGKMDKKVFYKIELGRNFLDKLKKKRYIKFKSHSMREISKKDEVALRIYKYISTKRFKSNDGEDRLETLCGIIPLKMIIIQNKKLKSGEIKKYTVSKLSQALKRVKKAFEILIELNYIKSYEVVERKEDKSWNIYYIFNNEKVGHVSSLLPHTVAPKNKKMITLNGNKNIKKTNKIKDVDYIENMEMEKSIEIVKRYNIYFSKAYNEKVRKKLYSLKQEEALLVLEKIKVGLNKEITHSMVKYINAMLSEVKKEVIDMKEKTKSEIESKRIEKIETGVIKTEEYIEKKKIDQEEKVREAIKNLFNMLDEEKQEKIYEKAKQIYIKEKEIEKWTNSYKRVFDSEYIKYIYIQKAMELV